MRVEVKHGDRPVPLRGRVQQRQRDGVVAADRDDPLRLLVQGVHGTLDLIDGLGDVERIHRDVAGIDDLREGERRYVLRGVVRTKQPRRLAHVGWAEARARTVADTAVERHADDRDVGRRHVFDAGQPRERRDARVAGARRGVDRADRFTHDGSP